MRETEGDMRVTEIWLQRDGEKRGREKRWETGWERRYYIKYLIEKDRGNVKEVKIEGKVKGEREG